MNSVDDVDRAAQYHQRGDPIMARSILANVVKRDPKNIRAWMVLSVVVDDADQKKYCINRVLDLDPNNQNARKMLNAQLQMEQASVKMDNAIKLRQTAASLGSISFALIIIGISLPCIVIFIGALLTK